MDDGGRSGGDIDVEELWDSFDEKLQPAGLSSLDVLMSQTIGCGNTVVDIFAGRDSCMATLFIPVAADSKGAIWT